MYNAMVTFGDSKFDTVSIEACKTVRSCRALGFETAESSMLNCCESLGFKNAETSLFFHFLSVF